MRKINWQASVFSCLLGGCLWGLTACENDLFTKEVNNAKIPYTPGLVVESFICPQDTVIQVKVRRKEPTVGIVEEGKDKYDAVADAQVTLSDGSNTVTLAYDKFLGYQIKASQLPISPGKTYFLKVSSPDGLSTEASCTVPMAVVDTNRVELLVEFDKKKQPKIIVRWPDFPGEVNYYSIFELETYAASNLHELRYYSISDEGQDGAWLSQRVGFKRSEAGYEVVLFICNTDRHYYEFHRTLAIQAQNRDNPFAQPSPLYTNIQGGLGVFAAYNRAALSIE
ncbi:MAG: DUF4249 domain-containing protein [Bacteroidota bacterium]